MNRIYECSERIRIAEIVVDCDFEMFNVDCCSGKKFEKLSVFVFLHAFVKVLSDD